MALILGGGVSSESKLSDDSIDRVHICTLDKVLENEPISFIKMDIEGAELGSLKGAKEIIMVQKPTLAICIYHSNKDILEIVDYISRLVPEYKLYIRHYSLLFNETVLYAVYPKC